MDIIAGMTVYDLIVIALFGLLIGRGIWLGFLRQITGLFALYFGYFAASQYHDRILPLLRGISDNPKVVFLASYLVLFLVTYVVVLLLGKVLRHIVQLTFTSWFDRLLGAVVGFAKAVILVILLHMGLGAFLAPENQMLRNCLTCGVLGDATDVARELIRNENVRKALIQHKPAISLDAVKEYLQPAPKKSAESGGGTVSPPAVSRPTSPPAAPPKSN
ncbi:MAG: CvpA family protein [Deltaproteobacteria bacterium]|nr:CvpA family protein [Deltaproteobacteria bacterium]